MISSELAHGDICQQLFSVRSERARIVQQLSCVNALLGNADSMSVRNGSCRPFFHTYLQAINRCLLGVE